MHRRKVISIILLLAVAALPWGVYPADAGPGAVLDPPLYPGGGGAARPTYYANSPAGAGYSIVNPATGATVLTNSGTALSKFVDALPGLGLPGCTVSATPGTGTCNENNMGQYIPVANADTLTFANSDYYVIGLSDHQEQMHSNLPGTGYGSGTKIRGYYQINDGNALGGTTDHSKHYLGPLIIATKDRPVRIKFVNNLGVNGTGDLFIPMDTTVMGAGMGPDGVHPYTQNRATIHIHGGHTPWISDGTPHQWITPAGETSTIYLKGLSQQNVPDMPDPGDGAATFFYTNQQSGRLVFYHDHAYGTTRLNVYVGEASGYLIVDQAELDLILNRTIPNICAGSDGNPDILCEYKFGIPLVIQDKTFVPANVGGTLNTTGQDTLWNIAAWGGEGNLWFPHVYEPAQDPAMPSGLSASGRWDWGPYVWPPSPVTNPVLPALSTVPEAFMDTPIVNGTAYPYLTVQAKAYRFRVLSAANDRSLNLQLYYADPTIPAFDPFTGQPNPGYLKEVKMVPANGQTIVGPYGPVTVPSDGRDGGVPDPALAGPQMIQIGTEGGLLPAPVTLPNQPITFDAVGNIANKTLLLMPAERADVLIDFTGVTPGSAIILYNDAPAALPGGDPRYDYYTGNPDQTASGGAPPTVAGFGPNTRTIMQFRVVAAAAPITTVNTGTLPAALLAAYTASQAPHIVPDNTFAKLLDTQMIVNGVTYPFKGKSINEGFDSTYGRINAMLGTEDPSGLNPSVPLAYIDPATEIVSHDRVQLWKITHNGVDSHPIHFHLTDVQVVNRAGWDGSIKPPDPSELGWKDTVRMNPQEDIIVAMRPTVPALPFVIPDSIRPLDVTMPVSVSNPMTNFGHEYVWHCHILGHEEFDLMRPLLLNNNLLYVDFAGTGLWQWDGTALSQINTIVPTSMVTAGSTLYADFAGYGLYSWNGTAWTLINTVHPASMVASGTTLYADFAGYGLYSWNGTTWTQINTVHPASMVASGSTLYADFAGYGLYSWNGTAWTQINTVHPASMVATGTTLYADFAGYGLYSWNGTEWTQINTVHPASMVASGTMLYADFTAYGLYSWNGTAWTQINTVHPASMVAHGSLLYADFTAYGLYKWDGTAWTQINTVHPTSMIASGSVLYAGFAGTGLSVWDIASWTPISANSPANMVSGAAGSF